MDGKRIMRLLGLAVMLALTLSVWAQPAAEGGGERGNRGGRGNRQRFDPAQFQARMMERMKERLKAGDEEWQAMEPLLSDVLSKQRELRQNRFGFGRRWRNEEGAEEDTAAAELEKAVEKENASADEIKTKLAAYRQDRAQKQAALEGSQEKLREILTVEQEAKLVLMGVLQ